MLEKDTWYKGSKTDEMGLFAGIYTYFKVVKYCGDNITISIYDLARDTSMVEPFLTMIFERWHIEPYAREVSKEEIGESLVFIAKLMLSGA